MTKVITTEVHQRTHRRTLDKSELERVLVDYLSREVGVLSSLLSVKVTFDDETQGSPAYTVGTKATVVLVEDLTPEHGR